MSEINKPAFAYCPKVLQLILTDINLRIDEVNVSSDYCPEERYAYLDYLLHQRSSVEFFIDNQ